MTISKLKYIALRNRTGQPLGEEIPDNVQAWYEEMEFAKTMQGYLVKMNNNYGFLYVEEFISEPVEDLTEDDLEFIITKYGHFDLYQEVKRIAAMLMEWFKTKGYSFQIFVEESSGVFGGHELAVFIPYGTGKLYYSNFIKEYRVGPTSEKSDLCMVRRCRFNNGQGTCKVEMGIPFTTLHETVGTAWAGRAIRSCSYYQEEVEIERQNGWDPKVDEVEVQH